MKLINEANQDDTFNRLIGKIQVAIGGVKGQPKGLLDLAPEFGDGGVKPVSSQRAALDQAIADLQKARAMMFNLS
jgi:hypothetical protein